MEAENGLNTRRSNNQCKSCKERPGVYTSIYRPSYNRQQSWTSVTSTKRTNVFTGLGPTKRYWFQVAAIGTHEQIA
jgi:hypothetical protein